MLHGTSCPPTTKGIRDWSSRRLWSTHWKNCASVIRKSTQRRARNWRRREKLLNMKAITEPPLTATATPADPLPPLEQFDSARAWRMVAAAFVAMFAAYGVSYSFGAFFKPMAAEFGAPRSPTSAVFSITVLVWAMLGPVTSHLSDPFGPRIVAASGALPIGPVI